jgi:hypothetical protein
MASLSHPCMLKGYKPEPPSVLDTALLARVLISSRKRMAD